MQILEDDQQGAFGAVPLQHGPHRPEQAGPLRLPGHPGPPGGSSTSSRRAIASACPRARPSGTAGPSSRSTSTTGANGTSSGSTGGQLPTSTRAPSADT